MSILEWWDTLGLSTQIFYCVAIPSTLVLLIQTVMMLLGMDDIGADIEVDADIPDGDMGDGIFGEDSITETPDAEGIDSLKLLSVKSVLSFLVIFGWVGVVMLSSGVKLPVAIIVAIVSGALAMVGVAYLMRAAMKLRSNGAADNRNAIGVAGRVHLTIPPSRSGEGKVHVMLQGALVERNAVTDEAESIPTGSEIVVVSTSGQTSLVVKRK